jgi:hypothetical protein
MMVVDGQGFEVEEALRKKGQGEEEEGGDELWLPHDVAVVVSCMCMYVIEVRLGDKQSRHMAIKILNFRGLVGFVVDFQHQASTDASNRHFQRSKAKRRSHTTQREERTMPY